MRRKTIRRCLAVLTAVMLQGGMVAAMGEKTDFRTEAWYAEALQACVVSPGNIYRLKKVLERARGGETLTLATVGGSITEGARASRYDECWAKRVSVRFASAYGTGGGSIHLVNAGVGGTSSTFGYMRYGRDVLGRIPETDPDGLPDLVVIEYAVNDWEEATGFRCFESMVNEILSQPNEPAVILLFSVAERNWNMQPELQKIGERYALPMVSMKNGIYPHLDQDYPKSGYFADEYHPTSVGHLMMADAVMCLLQMADEAAISPADTDLSSVKPVYGTDFIGLRTVYGDRETEGVTVERGGFDQTDRNSYRNQPVGWVCGENFHHSASSGSDPLKITGVFRKCIVAWRACSEASFGTAEVLVDGVVKKTLKGGEGKWGQSEPVLILDDAEAAEHTVEIRVKEDGKCFTVTAVSVQ